jgi:hypothetical protein
MNSRALIIQPGAYGDILLCAPIAKWYHDQGHEVDWPVRIKYHELLTYFDYVRPIILNEETLDPDWLRSDVLKIIPSIDSYEVVLNLADRGPHPTAQLYNENFEQCKYRLSNVDFERKNELTWTRNTSKEKSLYELVVGDKKNYVFCHLTSSRGDRAELPQTDRLVVEAREITGYNILDWYSVIVGASEIYCVESAFHQFIDGIIGHISSAPKYLLSRSTLNTGEIYTTSQYWNKKYIL